MNTQLKEYLVTEQAGHFVAGQRSPGAGKTIRLTPEQAMFALSAGQLTDPSLQVKEKKKGKAAPAENTSAGEA